MKKILTILAVMVSLAVTAQIPGSTTVNSRYDWLGGHFKQLKFPAYSDTSSVPTWASWRSGDIMLDTSGADAGTIYVRYGSPRRWVAYTSGTAFTAGFGLTLSGGVLKVDSATVTSRDRMYQQRDSLLGVLRFGLGDIYGRGQNRLFELGSTGSFTLNSGSSSAASDIPIEFNVMDTATPGNNEGYNLIAGSFNHTTRYNTYENTEYHGSWAFGRTIEAKDSSLQNPDGGDFNFALRGNLVMTAGNPLATGRVVYRGGVTGLGDDPPALMGQIQLAGTNSTNRVFARNYWVGVRPYLLITGTHDTIQNYTALYPRSYFNGSATNNVGTYNNLVLDRVGTYQVANKVYGIRELLNGGGRTVHNHLQSLKLINTAGTTGINDTTRSNVLLEMESTNRVVLFPRMNTTQMSAISSPPTGSIIYNTDSVNLLQYTGSVWIAVGVRGSGGGSGVSSVAAGYGTNFTTITSTGSVIIDSTKFPDKTRPNIFTGAQEFRNNQTGFTPGTNNQNTLRINNAAGGVVVQMGSSTGSTGFGALYLGTITPSAGNPILVGDGSTNVVNALSSIQFRINNGASPNVMQMSNQQRVGINQNTPAYKLDVLGSGNFSDSVRANFIFRTRSANVSSSSTDSVLVNRASDGLQMTRAQSDLVTVSNGLTKSGINITNNLITGISGSQTIIGGTGATDGLVITPNNSANSSGSSGTSVRIAGGNLLGTPSGGVWVSFAGLVGVTQSTPTSNLHVNASFATATALTAGNVTLDNTHHTMRADATTGNISVTLPTASTCVGRIYVVKKTDGTANTVTVVGTINGTSNRVINTQHSGFQFQSNGTDWDIIASY